MSEKETKHNILVRLLSESPITHDSAVYALVRSIDKAVLEESDIIHLGFDFADPESGIHTRKEKGPNKLAELAARSPGLLGDIYSFAKKYKWYQIYMGFAGVVLVGTLLFKWFIRLVTGNF